MHLQGSLQNFVGDGGVVGGLSFARLVDPHFTRCIEIESNIVCILSLGPLGTWSNTSLLGDTCRYCEGSAHTR